MPFGSYLCWYSYLHWRHIYILDSFVRGNTSYMFLFYYSAWLGLSTWVQFARIDLIRFLICLCLLCCGFKKQFVEFAESWIIDLPFYRNQGRHMLKSIVYAFNIFEYASRIGESVLYIIQLSFQWFRGTKRKGIPW